MEITGAYRISHEILGNSDDALHAHLIRRSINGPEQLRNGPSLLCDKGYRDTVKFSTERDQSLMQEIAHAAQQRWWENMYTVP